MPATSQELSGTVCFQRAISIGIALAARCTSGVRPEHQVQTADRISQEFAYLEKPVRQKKRVSSFGADFPFSFPLAAF